MEKRKMTVTVAGKPYTLVSADLPSAQTAVLTCFQLAEDLLKAQDENRMLQRRMEEMTRKD